MQMSKFEKKTILIDLRDQNNITYVYAQALNEKDLNYALSLLNDGLNESLGNTEFKSKE
jgi:hypothetical protein